MDTALDLIYDPNSFAGTLNENVIRSFEEWLHASGQTAIRFPEVYVTHLKQFHGGAPRKRYFPTPDGQGHVLTRFLNFLPSGSKHPLREYAVQVVWSAVDDRLGSYLMPFAECFNGDLVCFDFGTGGEPEIVLWDHERSNERAPHKQLLAKSFAAFLQTLSETPPNTSVQGSGVL